MCLEHIKKPDAILEHEIRPSIHDAMNIGHDRIFKRMGWMLKQSCPADTELCL